MVTRHIMRKLCICGMLLTGGCVGPARSSLSVYCGGGVFRPMSECVARFEERTGTGVDLSSGSSRAMFEEARRKHGDMYVAGDIEYISEAERDGIVASRRTVCYVTPVLAVRPGNPKKILSVRDLGRPGVRFYLVDPERCQQGILGERILRREGVTAEALRANRVSELSEGETVPSMIKAGKLDAALVWKRGAAKMGKDVEIVRSPELTGAACPVAAVTFRWSRNKTKAGVLLDFLGGEGAGRIFTRHGFSTGPPGTGAGAGLELPDYENFGEKSAARFNATAKKRPIVYRRLAEYLVERFDLASRPGIGVDIGSGPGDLLVELASRTEKFYWVNADINTWYAKHFSEDTLKHGIAHRTGFLFADACALPFRDGYADLVVSRGCYQFWGDLEQGLREVHRVLKPGGDAFIGRGFPPTMPESEVRDLFNRKIVGGPKYDPDGDATLFRAMMKKIGVKEFEVIRHEPKDASLNYGVWVYFRK